MSGPGFGAERLDGFLAGVASDAPTPGGGAVAGLMGAAGAALIGMVARLTIGREGFRDVEARMRVILEEADAARGEFLRLAEHDAAAFRAVLAAFKLPKGTQDEKATRAAAVQEAFAGAAAAPLEVARLAVGLLPLALEVTERGNPNAASDGASAAQALHASVHGAAYNVEINLAALKDAERVAAMQTEVDVLRARSREVLAAADEAFRRRVSS